MNKLELPRKDKNGISYLSYSQISLFLRDKKEYKEVYINNRPFEGNEYTDFGIKVGRALEENDYSKFNNSERDILKKVKRLDVFERKTVLNYEGFYVVGYIDSVSSDYLEIIDYKTGGKGKEEQYKKIDYIQIQLYALSLRQETGITPQKGSVEFIRRKGNLYKGEKLIVADELPISISVDLSEDKLKKVYWETMNIAKDIEKFYKDASTVSFS